MYPGWPKEDTEEAFRYVETIQSRYRQQNGSVSMNAVGFRQTRAARRSRLKIVIEVHSFVAIRSKKYLLAHANADHNLSFRARIDHVRQIC